MTLTAGSRLGPYEILAPLGAGGMGEVYRARDAKLGREVAIKVLPEAFAADADRLARFRREAQVLAALNHAHIAAIYGLEEAGSIEGLVMELVPGVTLAERLANGPIPIDESLEIARQIADGLEAAHEKGIVHRDLKPANVKLTPEGKIKILDFGLAKALTGDGSSPDASHSPTLTAAATQAGVVIGTAAYMSPEQARGRSVDRRADVWAFGVVLYEMLSGRRAFEGETVSDTLAAVLMKDPDWSRLPAATPESVRRVLRRCLDRNPKTRLHDIADARNEMDEASPAMASAPIASRPSRAYAGWLAAAVAAAVAVAVAAFSSRRHEASPRVVRLSLVSPPGLSFEHTVVAPDGLRLAFVGQSADGKRSLWIRPLDSLKASPLTGTEGAALPFWSPDGSSIGFFADGKLKRVEASGGPPQVLADATDPNGGSWSREGVILFCAKPYSPLSRIPAGGGPAAACSKLSPGEDSHIWPAFLPDGRHYVFLADAASTAKHSIRLGSLDSVESDVLVPGAVTSLAVAPPDWILFVRAGDLVAQRLDLKARRLAGAAVPLGDQIRKMYMQHGFEFSVSETGVLVYRSADPDSKLAWFDLTGKRLSEVGGASRYNRLELSPDERQVAFERMDTDGRNGSLWLIDAVSGATSRLTSTQSSDYGPTWSPDGKRVLYGSARAGLGDIYEIAAGGGSGDRLVYHDGLDKSMLDWSRDGTFALMFPLSPDTREDIWLLRLVPEVKATPLVTSRFADMDGQISPDGKGFAYTSDESGRPEVYVQSFADASSRHQVSTAGGVRPRWRGDGRELFFVTGSTLQAVEIKLTAGFEAGRPRDLFRLPAWVDYAVTRDGKRVLAAVPIDEGILRPPTVVVNWTAAVPRP